MGGSPVSLRFSRAGKESFNKIVSARVRAYFEQNNITTKANAVMVIKTIIMTLIYVGPLLTMLIADTGVILTQVLFLVMGMGMAGVGMSVMHDANHGAYSRYNWVNKLIGSSIYFISGNVTTWKVQHNIMHHTFTNVEGHDEDIDSSGLLRLHPSQEWKPVFRYQVWYGPILYGLMTLNWVAFKDFKQLLDYRKRGVGGVQKLSMKKEWFILIASKAIYFFIFLALPIIIMSISWYWVVLGFIIMHFISGVVLSFIFQLAHVVGEVDNPAAPESGKIEDEWMEHQLRTTANFSPNSKWIGWYVGGLNHQIEHHLFPNICHVHYPAIAKIVKKTADEFGLPYHEQPNFLKALRSHFKFLIEMGRPPLAIR